MIIGNGRVITNDLENTYIENGAVLIEGDTILEVGDFETLKAAYPDQEVFDVKGRLIMPGMINAHSHIYSAYARGMAVSKPTRNFFEILENQWWALDKSLNLEDCKLNAYTTYIESIRNGVTTLFDHHASPNAVTGSLSAIAEAASDLGIRTLLCYELSDRDGMAIRDKGIEENVSFIKKVNPQDQDMIKGMFGMHASFTLSDESLYKTCEAMAGLDAGYHVHVGEGIEDEYDSLKKYGKRVAERFFDFGMLGPKTIAVHCVAANQRELNIIKDTDTTVVHNPMSNMGNAVGYSPVVKMREMGIRVGLGTDAYTNDMFESMKVAKILQSHHLSDPTVGFGQALDLQLNQNPAICENYFQKPLGRLVPGAYADIITVDYNAYTPMRSTNTGGHILFGLTGRMVNDTMINGQFVMRDREIMHVDEAAIFARSTERAAEVWKGL